MKKILIVDNTIEEREDVYNILLLEGYQVFQAENGSVGFIMALKENPDLIISEVILPKLTGLGMLKKLNKETTTNIPLIFLSKKNKKEDVRNGMNAGAEDYLEKPFDKEELITVVKRVLKKQQLIKNKIQELVEKDNYFQREAGRMTKIGYWTYDKQSNIRTWSKVVREIFGMNQEEIPSYDIMLNCLNKDSRTKHNKAVLNLAKNGKSYDMEFEIKNLRNEKRWIQDIGEPIYNPKNQIIGQRGIIRDITVLKKNQDAINQSNERFEMAARATNHAIWDWNILDGKIYRNKDGFNEVFGMDSQRLEEETYQAGAYIHPDDQKRIEKQFKKIIQSINQKKFSLEYRSLIFDGKCIYVEDNGYIVRDDKGRAIRMIGAARNITQSKKAEQLMIDEKEIMEKIASNQTLKSILKAIALAIEKQIDNSICSILLMDVDGIHLRHGAAPNLPKDYNLAIDGMALGENAGSCGSAAYKKKGVFVSDIATDPLWEEYKELTLSHGLKACWSLPIISKKDDNAIGTIAIYYTKIAKPSPSDIELLKRVSNYIRIAIEKNISTNILINSETKYRNLFDRNLAGTYQTSIEGRVLRVNTTFANIFGYDSPKKLVEQKVDILYFSKEEREVFIKDLKKDKKLINREKIVKHKNGSIVYILENCYLQRDPLLGIDIIEGVIIDITERKKAEEALTAYKHFFYNTANFSCIANVQGYFEVINSNFEKVLGYDERELLESQFMSFIHPDDIDLTLKEIEKLQDGATTTSFENRYRKKDGNYLWLDWNSTPNPINGKLYAVARDITERKEFEKSLEESISNIEAILESTADGILVVDNLGNIVRFNKKFLELWKIPKHIMTSIDCNRALDSILDQLENPQQMIAKVKELYANPEAISSDIIELKDGRVFERYSHPNTMNGVNRGRVWSYRDITERVNFAKEKQQLFALIETSKEIISFGNMKGNPTFINKAGKKMLGIDENIKLSNYHFSQFVANESKDYFHEIIQPSFLKNNFWEGDMKIINIKTKKLTELFMSIFVILDNTTGVPIGMGNVSFDITEREKTRRKLIDAVNTADKLAGFKDQFMSNMSHEIRTPLGIILGFTKILLRNDPTETQKRQLKAIKNSGDTLLVVINDILDFSKIEAGKMVLEEYEINVPHIIESVLNTFELRLKEKELRLHTQYDNRIPEWLLGDAVRINQIVLNLIDNAIKFTSDGGTIDVKVNLLKEDHKKTILEIKVTDTGIGVAPDQLKNIFDPFTQSMSTTTRKYGGSGLGLNIVKQLIDLMDGTISVKSKLSVGSVFTFTLSLNKVPITADKPKIIVPNNKKLKKLGNLKILIVDDMFVNQFLAQTIINDFGFESDTADNGKIAIELLEKNEYDVILMDLQMPEMNGWDATTYIRNNMKPQKAITPIIAVTADITKRDVDRCKEVGIDEYVSKPINEAELLKKIIHLVNKKHKEIENQQETTKICNLEYLSNRFHNKPKLLKEMLEIILKELPPAIKQLGIAIANNDWKGLSLKIHSIKPTLLLMGLPKEIISISKQIEENAEKEEHLDLVPAQFIKLEKALEKGCKELEAELKTIKN